MAGSGHNRIDRRQDERVVPSLRHNASSRVSKAEGSQGMMDIQGTRVEQRSSVPASRRGAATTRSAPSKRGGATHAPTSSAGRRSPASSNRGPSVGSPSAASDPRDVQFVYWARKQWNSLEPHQQQRVFSSFLLVLSLLLLASLTVFRTAPVWSSLEKFFLTFFGWSAYPFSVGLVAFAIAHLIEGIRNIRFLRWSLVTGLVVILLLLLMESRLIMGHLQAGVLAELLVSPLLGWSPAVGHITILGLLLITIVLTFHITFSHVLLVGGFLYRLVTAEHPFSARAEEEAEPSPYLGQRPRYSRYADAEKPATPGRQVRGGQAAAQLGQAVQVGPRPRRTIEEMDNEGVYGSTGRHVRRSIEDLEAQTIAMEDDDVVAFDDGVIKFESDFPSDIDVEEPQDSIPHRPSRPRTPRRGREPRALDPQEHARAVQGAQQQELPIEEAAEEHGKLVLPSIQSGADMEPLIPNPKLVKQKSSRAAAQVPIITSPWKLPSTTLLSNPDTTKVQMYGDDTSSLAKTIQDTLRSFRVDAEVKEEDISIGPTVIRFGIRPTGKPEMIKDEKTGKMVPVRDASGQIVYEARTRVSRIMALQNDLALVLEAKTIRMEAPVPGRPYVGVEIPNKNSRLVTLREVLESKEYQTARAKSKLAIGLGKDVAGQVRVGDLARMPHLLIAGATGAGKSVCINTIIASILMQATPDDVRLLMVDPKMVELNMYNGIPHLLSPVVIEVDKVVSLLKNAIGEMERRYRLFSQLGVRNLDGYRKLRLEKIAQGDTSLNNLPAIVIIIDELADLMMAAPEEVEGMICRLAQLARATGIHLVVATQRPSVDVITGLIKANIPTRISFMVSSAVDSRTIIDMGGAERLLGRGDMLYLPADAGRPERIQGAFLSDDEAHQLADYWRQQVAEHEAVLGRDVAQPVVEPGWELKEESDDGFELEDDLLDKAEEVVREYGRASISLLQRRLRVGYSRAARLIDLLEQRGIIGHSEPGGRAREVYDQNNGGYEHSGEDGHSLADEVADIVAEEKERNEFLRAQASRHSRQPQYDDETQV